MIKVTLDDVQYGIDHVIPKGSHVYFQGVEAVQQFVAAVNARYDFEEYDKPLFALTNVEVADDLTHRVDVLIENIIRPGHSVTVSFDDVDHARRGIQVFNAAIADVCGDDVRYYLRPMRSYPYNGVLNYRLVELPEGSLV